MFADCRNRFRAQRRHDEIAGLRLVSVRADFLLQPRLQLCLLFHIELRERLAGPAGEHPRQFPVQPVRRRIRCDIGTVAPDRADFLYPLKHALSPRLDCQSPQA